MSQDGKQKIQKNPNQNFFSDMWTCEDIDECAEGLDMCDENSLCLNTYGDYECFCSVGAI